MGCWGKLFRLLARYSPPGTQVDFPVYWGEEPILSQRLGPDVTDLCIKREAVRFRSPSAAHWVEFMKTHLGPLRDVTSLQTGANGVFADYAPSNHGGSDPEQMLNWVSVRGTHDNSGLQAGKRNVQDFLKGSV